MSAYVTGMIESVELVGEADEDCKITLIGGGNFSLNYSGSNIRGTEGKVFTTLFGSNGRSIPFGLHFHYAPLQLALDIRAAINAALAMPALFMVDVADDFVEVAYNCAWNFDEQPNGVEYPEQRSNGEYIKDWILSFYAVEVIAGE
jgi:hypothetical protein